MTTITLTHEQAKIVEYALALHQAASDDIADDSEPGAAAPFHAISAECNAMRLQLVRAFDLDVDM